MFCTKCGSEIPENSSFCTHCGANTEPNNSSQTNATPKQTDDLRHIPTRPRSVSFIEAIKLFFYHYADFESRATKSEFWFAFLFQFLVCLALGSIPYIDKIVSVALLIPGLAISVRRLHDTGKNWTYILMGLIPIAGAIILIVYFCGDSDGNNPWGPVPTSVDEFNK